VTGSLLVVMGYFEREGPRPPTTDEKIRICRSHAYRILVDEVGVPPETLLFDPNIPFHRGHRHGGAQQLPPSTSSTPTRWIKATPAPRQGKTGGSLHPISFQLFRGPTRTHHVRDGPLHTPPCLTIPRPRRQTDLAT